MNYCLKPHRKTNDELQNAYSELLEHIRCTSKNRQEYCADFIPFGLASYFTTVITVDDSILPKPSAEPLLSYLLKTGANSQDIIYIGDTSYDCECANNAKIDFGLAMWGQSSLKQGNILYSFRTPEDILFIP